MKRTRSTTRTKKTLEICLQTILSHLFSCKYKEIFIFLITVLQGVTPFKVITVEMILKKDLHFLLDFFKFSNAKMCSNLILIFTFLTTVISLVTCRQVTISNVIPR